MQEYSIIQQAEDFVTAHFTKNVPSNFVFHSISHVIDVVKAVQVLGRDAGVSEEEMELLILAAWFHDAGYDKGSAGHEERSVEYATAFLTQQNYPAERIAQIKGCIMATKMPQSPRVLLESILCDADLSHLGDVNYWSQCGHIRQEIALTRDKIMSDEEWLEFELEFMQKHRYHTGYAEKNYGKRKKRHIRQLKKQNGRLHPSDKMEETTEIPVVYKKKKKKKKKRRYDHNEIELKDINLGRGVETMYRTAYRTHVNLSSMADSKANIMLSVNAIIISIIVSNLVPRFDENPKLIVPTVVLLLVCLGALTLAILSTQPKITKGKVTMEDIKKKQSNLLFFGNFYNMKLEDFELGMLEMIKDNDFLYSSMTRDIYYLGIVLAKKYRYLRLCYGVFMYGLIVAVLVFGLFML